MSAEQLHTAFQSMLQTLNPEQREAVEHIEGPVLLLAGPGTGKTHVLAARIGKILLESDARPQNILCLTFTDSGVLAMRKRLLQMIGPDAYRVNIFTFHGFCNRIIQENLEVFSAGEPDPLSELERVEIIRSLLEKLNPDHPLRQGRKSVFAYENQLRNLFSLMKREGWKPGFVQKQIRSFLAALPEHPDYRYHRNNKFGKKGEPKTAAIAAVTQRMQLLESASDLYPLFENALKKAGRYEFDDMLLWVLNAFEKNEPLLRNYQERYLYFLVDEYQDTNSAQYQLLQKLLDYWQNPNVFIVGDDDQSIFEFQGARLHNLLLFYRQYQSELFTRVLKTNYRSTQPILDAAAAVITNNTLRAVNTTEIDLEKNLSAATTEAGVSPLIRVYEHRIQENGAVLAEIEKLHTEGIPLREIAVLYAQHKQAELLLNLLQKKGIPYQTKRPVNILHIPLVRQVIELLQYLREEQQQAFSGDHRLFRLLHAPFWQLPPQDLARIALQLRENAETGTNLYWRTALADAALLNGLKLETSTAILTGIGQKLNRWIADGLNLPPALLLENLYNQTGLLNYLLLHPDKAWWLQVLHSLLDFAQKENARSPRLALDRLLDMLVNMDDNKLPLPVQQTLKRGDGVQLLSVHAAKGLEFGHVFLIDCTADFWEPSGRSVQQQFTLPDTLLLTTAEEDAMEARRRLFYVAMTRAQKGLYLSYSIANAEGKVLQPARFVSETGLPEVRCAIDPALVENDLLLAMLDPGKPVITLPETDQIDLALADFRLSISSMNRYLRCPLAFYYEDVLKAPAPMSEAAAFGQAMHMAVQQYFLKIKPGKSNQWPPVKTLLDAFGKSLERRRVFFTAAGFEQRLALGRDFLDRYHHDQIPYWRRRAITERRFDRVEVNGVPITGVVDKIEWLDDGSIRIVDYKTGAYNRKKIVPPDPEQPLGGEYWRQLAFYKILLENARIYPEPVRKTAIDWLEPDKNGRFSISEIQFNKEESGIVQNLITETYAKIMAHDFKTGCGAPDCAWCQLERERVLPYIVEREEDNLDD